MHFAYTPRKSSNPPPFRPSTSRLAQLRRTSPRAVISIFIIFVLASYFLLTKSHRDAYYEQEPSGIPYVVIVTVTDSATFDDGHVKLIQENRQQYAAIHGYETFVVPTTDYHTDSAPTSWAKLMAMRHALTRFPDCGYIWFLDQNALIMKPKIALDQLVLDQRRLAELMQPDVPVVPESIIKTFGHLSPDDVALVMSQDGAGIVIDSMLVKNGQWAKFFLETWLDPLYRSYNFEKAERHALEHAIQWHPTLLSKLAIVPQRILAPYSRGDRGVTYSEGDFVVVLDGCSQSSGSLGCNEELDRYWSRWKRELDTL